MSEPADMNGLWSGWYAYSTLSEPVPFTAWIDDSDGTLTGTILEPNTFSSVDLDDLQADIDGLRGGVSVMFSKLYRPHQGAHAYPIKYFGYMDTKTQKVRGKWSISADIRSEGPFEMQRASRSISEGILREVLAPVER